MTHYAIVSLSDPYGRLNGGTMRVRELSSSLRSLGNQVDHVFPGTGEDDHSVGESLGTRMYGTPLGVIKRRYLPMPTVAGARNFQLAQALREIRPDVLVLNALSQSWLQDAAPNSLVWWDFLDLWSEFGLREARARRGLARITATAQSAALRRLENRCARSADIVTAVGWEDVSILRARGVDARWLPTCIPLEDVPSAQPVQQVSKQLVAGFLANFDYWPNRDAYELLAKHWLPRLLDLGYSVLVAGWGSQNLAPYSDIECLGPVDSPADFYARVDVSLAPIRLGGGMKVKVVEALLRGIPVLATPHALEGLPPDVARLAKVVSESGAELGAPIDAPMHVGRHDQHVLSPYTADGQLRMLSEILPQGGH